MLIFIEAAIERFSTKRGSAKSISYNLLNKIIFSFIEAAIERCSTKRGSAKSFSTKGVLQ